MINKKPTYIIFGASGDLSKRYLLPALQNADYISAIIPISRKDYGNLKSLIPNEGEKIFHLAIPPEAVPDALKIISDNFKGDDLKIMLEKPFGRDLESAKSLITQVEEYFSEHQIYRVDHYLAKRSMQNLANEKWEKVGVSGIEIIASEKIDIEGRVNFYEKIGALRDFVQSHLLEMTAVTLAGSLETDKRREALANLEIVCDIKDHRCVKRGQYEGYREEVGNPESITETFVSINLVSKDKAWNGVPITLSTGKALSEKLTEIIVRYKDGHENIFNIEHESDAYERVARAVIEGERNLFISSGEILETWRILDKVQNEWQDSTNDLIVYKKGSTIDQIISQSSKINER